VEEITVGIIVDAISEVKSIDKADIEPPLNVVSVVNAQYLSGVAKLNDSLLILLNLEAIIGVTGEQGKVS
jgi:purine-binding chemotaxis protein CheW